LKRFYIGQVEQLSDDEVAGICISQGIKRDGDAWEPSGVDLTAYKQNPVILRDHDQSRVIGTAASIGLADGGKCIAIRIQFAPEGLSNAADEARGLAKAGMLKGISAGIDPIDTEPLRNGSRGMHVLTSELLEVSLVSVPADQDALITARSFSSRAGTLEMIAHLPRISQAAIDRVLSRAFAAGGERARIHPYQTTESYRQQRAAHARAVYAIGAGRAAERAQREFDSSYEERQRQLRELKAIRY
jgi:HK97 family phage prohead protease